MIVPQAQDLLNQQTPPDQRLEYARKIVKARLLDQLTLGAFKTSAHRAFITIDIDVDPADVKPLCDETRVLLRNRGFHNVYVTPVKEGTQLYCSCQLKDVEFDSSHPDRRQIKQFCKLLKDNEYVKNRAEQSAWKTWQKIAFNTVLKSDDMPVEVFHFLNSLHRL